MILLLLVFAVEREKEERKEKDQKYKQEIFGQTMRTVKFFFFLYVQIEKNKNKIWGFVELFFFSPESKTKKKN